MTMAWLVIAMVCLGASGLPGFLAGRRSRLGQWIATALNVAGSGIGLAAVIRHFADPPSMLKLVIPWELPIGRFALGLDDLSALFLIPIFVISGLGAVYGMEYWAQLKHPSNGQRLRLCWGLVSAGMVCVVLARDAIMLLMGWEVMALSAFFLVAVEDRKASVRDAAWVYLIATHLGTLSLFAFSCLLHYASGSFELWRPALASISPALEASLFVVGLVGFGVKAGIVPLHVWLPGAHANAPSHVSALMSGVMLKMGIYGVVRVAAMMPNPPVWYGGALLVAGSVSALVGVIFAVAQGDLKRMLAYSSIENIGIIMMGIGLALLGRSMGHADWIALGLAGAFLHVLNHSLFKPMLFLGAGNILHAARTRQMDLLGGLGRLMPWTFAVFVIGSIAICGLPPLNGFISELLIYLGLFRTLGAGAETVGWVPLAAPALALVGALAISSFVKLIGAVFCGTPRSEQAGHAHDPHLPMLIPAVMLGAGCLVIGLCPSLLVRLLNRTVDGWLARSKPIPVRMQLEDYAPFGWLSATAITLTVVVLVASVGFRRWHIRKPARTGPTWDCGYARSSPRIQYTSSSFTQMLAEQLAWVLWPRTKRPILTNVFPSSSHFESKQPDPVLDRGLRPGFIAIEWLFNQARILQRGPVQVYLLYVMVILLVLLTAG
jgi:formate hydrogenlyase subunit 3/multisubunit Na+/H+ antiporter MnhD subunit